MKATEKEQYKKEWKARYLTQLVWGHHWKPHRLHHKRQDAFKLFTGQLLEFSLVLQVIECTFAMNSLLSKHPYTFLNCILSANTVKRNKSTICHNIWWTICFPSVPTSKKVAAPLPRWPTYWAPRFFSSFFGAGNIFYVEAEKGDIFFYYGAERGNIFYYGAERTTTALPKTL